MSELMRTFLRPRWIACMAYLFYATAGASFMFFQSPGLKELLGGVGFTVWNSLLMVGGFTAAFGAIKEAKRVEMIGVPGVAVGLIVYALYLAREIPNSEVPGVVLGFSAICAGACVGAIGRGIEIHKMLKLRERVNDELKRETGEDHGGGGSG